MPVLGGMRNLEIEAKPVKAPLRKGSARGNSAGSAVYDAENLSSIRLDNNKLRRKNCSRKRAFASNK